MNEQNQPNAAECERLLAALSAPFGSGELRWKVRSRMPDGSRGLVIPFADPRAYTDRLNSLFTPSGWTRAYETHQMAGLSRQVGGKQVPTGKVMVTCVVEIFGIGRHSGTGEAWADDDNALTGAEAQAFKRACACFGLGRYLYELLSGGEDSFWVPLDQEGHPTQYPELPEWAIGAPAGPNPQPVRAVPATSPIPAGSGDAAACAGREVGQSATVSGSQSREPQRAPLRFAPEFAKYREELGARLHGSIVQDAQNLTAEALKGRTPYAVALGACKTAAKTLQAIRGFAEKVGEQGFFAVLDENNVPTLDDVPDFGTLRKVYTALAEADKRAEEQCVA